MKEDRRGRLKTFDEVPGYIALSDLAKVWGVTVSHVHLLIRDARLKPLRLGNQLVFPLGVSYPDPITPVAREAMKRKMTRDADMAKRVRS